MRGSDGKLCFSVKERGKVWKGSRMKKMIGIVMWKEMQYIYIFDAQVVLSVATIRLR